MSWGRSFSRGFSRWGGFKRTKIPVDSGKKPGFRENTTLEVLKLVGPTQTTFNLAKESVTEARKEP